MADSKSQQVIERPLKAVEKQEEESEEPEGYEMVLGDSMDSRDVRNDWIDAVERILREESWERSQQHARRNFEHASVHNEASKRGV